MSTTSVFIWPAALFHQVGEVLDAPVVYLLAFEGVQDGEVARVLQSEDDDFASMVKSWSSRYE